MMYWSYLTSKAKVKHKYSCVLLMLNCGVIQVPSSSVHFSKVCFVSAKLIFNHILFSFEVPSDCSAKCKYTLKGCCILINELIYFRTA